jgi:hypothetical protein
VNPLLYEFAAPPPASGPSSSNEYESIGYSVQGRPLIVHCRGNPGAGLRIFLLAGQHGDESDAREAAAEFLAAFRSDIRGAAVHLAVLGDANPDGAAAQTRRNASAVDLNRDHLLLRAPETAAIHSFVDCWQPDLIVDIHTYRPRRRELLQYDFVFPHDVMIDFPTNPAVGAGLPPACAPDLLSFLKSRMAEVSVRCDRYTLVRSGIVRHSNVDILDARNSLALRFEAPTILLEGRRASPEDPPIFGQPHVALLRSLETIVEWAAMNADRIKRQSSTTVPHGPVPLRCRYSRSRTPRYMEMQSATAGDIQVVGIPGEYLPFVRTTRSICAPRAYAVPVNLANVLATLKKQRFRTASASRFGLSATQIYRIESVVPSSDEDSPALPLYRLESVRLNLDEFVLFPADQRGGRLLTLFLEPDSQFGPPRFFELAGALQPGMTYPVARLV